MLTSVATWVLKYFLGKYVDNLNTQQLNIALLQGELELENLPLNREALRQIGFPIELHAGYIGKVKLQIPIRAIRSEPWVIILEHLYLVIGPVNLNEWDVEAEEQALLEQKLRFLDALEAQWRASLEGLDQGYYATSYLSWMNFGTSVLSTIIENLQLLGPALWNFASDISGMNAIEDDFKWKLKIADVHIRYEDNLTIAGQCFTFGLVLDGFVEQPTEEASDSAESTLKVFELSNLSLYFQDCTKDELLGHIAAEDFIVAMGAECNRGKQFVIHNVSGKAQIRKNRNPKPLRSKNSPRIICDVQFENFPITITDSQYGQLISWQKGLRDLELQMRFKSYRPACSAKEDPRAWWRYLARTLVLDLSSSEIKTWEEAVRRASNIRKYVDIYEKLLRNLALVLDAEEKELKDKLEQELGLEELRDLRLVAMTRVYKELGKSRANARSTFFGWVPQFWGSSSPEENSDVADAENLLKPDDDATFLKRDVVFGRFNFTLQKGSINLATDIDESNDIRSLMELKLEKVAVGFESRPRTSSFQLTIELGAILLSDKLSKDSTLELIRPQGKNCDLPTDTRKHGSHWPTSLTRLLQGMPFVSETPEKALFTLVYEQKPFNSCADKKLHVKMDSLDIVYKAEIVRFLTDFFGSQSQQLQHGESFRKRYQRLKAATKQELLKNWRQMVAGNLQTQRSTWDIDLDISAPRIMFVEHFSDSQAALVVIDLGRFHFYNVVAKMKLNRKDSEDEEAFATPCSTPPGSPQCEPVEESFVSNNVESSDFTEGQLYNMLYERYELHLSSMQVLVGRVQDNWKYAHFKGSSSLHVLDKFNISIQIEKRIVHTNDPQFPNLTFTGSLPRLVVHMNENKIASLRTIANLVLASPLSPKKSFDPAVDMADLSSASNEPDLTEPLEPANQSARLVTMQFTVHYLAIEVQSRGRSVAELQVNGVRGTCTRRPFDTSITLTVHSLLLVDAMQTYGRDYELLVASHKHVGMDSLSGSLRDSEPTSPVSPGSPEPADMTSSFAIHQALSGLSREEMSPLRIESPPPGTFKAINSPSYVPPRVVSPDQHDSALIIVEISIVNGSCPGHDGSPLQIASIQFNNLDVIANQETIVELLGFIKRVFPPSKNLPNLLPTTPDMGVKQALEENFRGDLEVGQTRTEITFDFHRLNVLLLRAVRNEGRKVCTATVMDAKITATIADQLLVSGSLGGIQVLDQTAEGQKHLRVLSVGMDPLAPPGDLLAGEGSAKAFSFDVSRKLGLPRAEPIEVDVKIRLASVWYTHSPRLLCELQSCASEFKQYLAQLAGSIRAAAAEMAMGLVNARAELLSGRLSRFGSSGDIGSPRRRRRSFSQSLDHVAFTPFTPHSPIEDDDILFDNCELKLDIILESPVVVLPSSSLSDYVFVGHLGRISIRNSESNATSWEPKYERYQFEVRDMNVSSVRINNPVNLNISGSDTILPRPEQLYSNTKGKPILHDTVIELSIEKSPTEYEWDDKPPDLFINPYRFTVEGGVVGSLKISLTRGQYQQLLNTCDYIFGENTLNDYTTYNLNQKLADIQEEETSQHDSEGEVRQRGGSFFGAVTFGVPEFTVELDGDTNITKEGPLVSISFRDFSLNIEKHALSSHLQMSLKSLVVEDLSAPSDSKTRFLVVSTATDGPHLSCPGLSKSCPSLHCEHPYEIMTSFNSLPDRINRHRLLGLGAKFERVYPSTPPPSPRSRRSPCQLTENLVLITVTDHVNGPKITNVDFNCLDVIVNNHSWVALFDFFNTETKVHRATTAQTQINEVPLITDEKLSKLELSVRSLTMVLVKPEYDVAKANISHLFVKSSTDNRGLFIEGRLGSMSILDLTPFGKLYRERFLTTGPEALYLNCKRYKKPENLAELEIQIEMSSVVYVHTQRFLMELYSLWQQFSQLQKIMIAMRSSDQLRETPSLRMLLSIDAGSPVLVLPIASLCPEVIVADLGQLTVRNGLQLAGSPGTISNSYGKFDVDCLLDVMSIKLVNMDLFFGCRVFEPSANATEELLHFGSVFIAKEGPSLLAHKCHLELQVDRNLDTYLSRVVPDVAVRGTLAKLEGTLDLAQYKLIRGLLSYNIGENLQDLTVDVPTVQKEEESNVEMTTWLATSIHLDLVNVVLGLRAQHGVGSSLANINFIKSRLVIEIYSDRSQDIDLVSSEILLIDTRYVDEPVNKRHNVFTNILQPLGLKIHPRNKLSPETGKSDDESVVQAEIHHRRRKDKAKSTILVHNMRVMAVLDWWEMLRDFIAHNYELPKGIPAEAPTDSDTFNTFDGPPFEFKLNVTDSEIVVVEDTSMWDTSAVILKSTIVITYKPNQISKPLSCNLNHCELFSCLLGMEDETALSIIDPVTVSLDIRSGDVSNVQSRGLGDLLLTSADRSLEVVLSVLNIRLSYHDFQLLARLAESVPKQTKRARNLAYVEDSQPANVRNQINKLKTLGFSEKDCEKALEISNNELDDAALWLTQNAKHTNLDNSEMGNDSNISFDSIEFKVGVLSIVVIDDCRDADVPLVELSLNQLILRQNLSGHGHAKFLFTADYYNRLLSGWEPFIEPWRCNLKWENSFSTNAIPRSGFHLEIHSDEILNINITSTLLELYNAVKETWTEDYYDMNGHRGIDQPGSLAFRRRSPFVPFALKNETGCLLWFTTFTKTTDNITDPVTAEGEDQWIQVESDETVPFSFEVRDKVRHKDTHKIRVHQIVVRAGLWRSCEPVTIDRVGVFFRRALPPAHLNQMELPPARLVFNVTLEGSARKLVTVRSALILNNQLNASIEAKLENTVTYAGAWYETLCLQIPAKTAVPVPLTHAHSHIWIRPIDKDMGRYHAFSSSPLGWMSVTKPGEVIYEAHQCHSNRDCSYRFMASIYHERFPESQLPNTWLQPAHTITLNSPVQLTNLLPCDLHYSLRHANIRGHIKPGDEAHIYEVDGNSRAEMNIQVDGFVRHGTLVIPNHSASGSFRSDIRLHDSQGRRLVLDVEVDILQSAGVRITISVPFWVVNKTSLPIVIRQEGSSTEAAGQFEENEVGRVVTPLLFSLADSEASPMAQLRIGTGYHLPSAQSQWCQPFPLQIGPTVLRLKVVQRDRPDIIYILGINIRHGRGRYRKTKIITLSPRYQLHNKSSLTLQFAQLCLATTVSDPAAAVTYGKAVSECSLAWHWPRPERPRRLCVRLPDVRHCMWSGGFAIDNDDSFYINIRDINGKMHFLRVEIVLQAATYFTVFTDTDSMPPPVRIDNCSLVPIHFYQNPGVDDTDTPRTMVRAQNSMAYAWDLPQGNSALGVVAPGGSLVTCNLNQLPVDQPGLTLTYENFIYIAFTATFNRTFDTTGAAIFEPLDVESQQLVLDCLDGQRVVINRKQEGARSQLWRMTSSGQLQHEGSSPPRDPKSKSAHRSDLCLVLDIDSAAPQPSKCVPLVLRRCDQRRASTQTWRFTPEGRLMCKHSRMCVQAKDGFFGLRQGSEAVLGPCQHPVFPNLTTQLPLEHQVSRMKMRPGSGCLLVSVASDGPTRVLKIVDPIDSKTPNERDSEVNQKLMPDTDARELQVTLKLTSGLGVSLISSKPAEELLYLQLRGLVFNYDKKSASTSLDCSIEDIQCDNQLQPSDCDVVLHVTRAQRDDEGWSRMPAIVISAVKQHTHNINAHIFKHLIVHLKRFSLCIEERLLLKVSLMAGLAKDGWSDRDEGENEEEETQKRVIEATSVHATRYYFGLLRLSSDQIRLSVVTTTKLPNNLQAAKKQLGLRLLKFEDAAVDVKEFARQHLFETWQCLVNAIVKHIKIELAWQAASILGSVDFLGNPLGFVNDISEGMTGLIYEGNVSALVKSVTHGISNSTAKVTGSLSDGLGKVIMDESHEEMRQRIRRVHSGSSSDHVLAGLKGLGFGLLGGFTSIFKQTYEGVNQEGFQGIFSGVGKGLVGTVTKPVAGVLDLFSETASAVRDSSRASCRVSRVRLPRIAAGPRGLLPSYSAHMATGQRFFHSLRPTAAPNEMLVSYEVLRSEAEDMRILVTTENVIVFTASSAIVLEIHLSSVYHAAAVTVEDPNNGMLSHYIELSVCQEALRKRPRVRCDARDIAERVCQQINYGHALHEESLCTVMPSD